LILLKVESFLGITKSPLVANRQRRNEHARDSFSTDNPNAAFAKDNSILLGHSSYLFVVFF
jgi:hypothetical protein